MWLIGTIQADPPASGPSGALLTGVLIGLMGIWAIVGGTIAHALRLPRVVGYIAGGAVLHLLAMWWMRGAPESRQVRLGATESSLDLIVSTGLALILFSIGGVFEARRVRTVWSALPRIALAESGLTFLMVLVVVGSAALVTAPADVERSAVMSFALLLACGAIATAPAATLFVLREHQAKGPVTDTILSLVGVNNVAAVVLFQIAFVGLAAGGVIETGALAGRSVWLELAYVLGGSVVVGLGLGLAMAVLHERLRAIEGFVVLVALVLVFESGSTWMTTEHGYADVMLLGMLIAGAVFANAAINAERLNETVRTIGAPIFISFFVIAGYRLHLDDLAHLGVIGVAYIAARTAGKLLGVWVGVRWLGPGVSVQRTAGLSLLCQAAVIIGLAEFVRTNWKHDWAAPAFATTVFGSVAIFELTGPLLCKWVVVRAGEVKLETLLRRSDASSSNLGAPRRAISALGRSLGIGSGAPRTRPMGPLKVRHVMRSNAEMLSASDGFDEVMRFVERSRLNDFPVVDELGELVGVIHYSHLRRVIYDPAVRSLVTAADLVSDDTPMLPADTPLDESVEAFQSVEATALPVSASEQSRQVIGIVEQRDVLRALHTAEDG